MPRLTRVLLTSLVVACAPPALARDTVRDIFFERTIPVPALTYDNSDANLLAERHLALYRASRQLPPQGGALGNVQGPANDERDVASIAVRTSATAKLPLSSRSPNPEN